MPNKKHLESKFRRVLRKIYREPHGITLIEGNWKTGKTNFAIHLYEILKDMKLISEAAGNIQMFKDEDCTIRDNSEVKHIDNFTILKAWMFHDVSEKARSISRKIFFYDEAMKNAPSKRAMTRLNSEWQKVIPELSKGKVHLLAMTQEQSMTEKIFKHPTFNVATWKKVSLPPHHKQFLKRVTVTSKLLKEKYLFNDIGKCRLIYNPYLSASWTMEPTDPETLFENSIELRVAYDYAHGLSTDRIKAKYEEIRDRKEATRMIRKALRVLYSKWQVAEVSSGVIVPDGGH